VLGDPPVHHGQEGESLAPAVPVSGTGVRG
jgi:hypothetical protein